ncbi:MAG: HipA domain-containing protein [Legionellales bacterium]|jgi:serine/threonine-protein kinase HipA
MSNLLFGKVYYQDNFAGFLREEPGQGSSFCYDSNYLVAKLPPISYTLPLRETAYVCPLGLLPFFDNLVAEGWLETVQMRLLGKRQASRFELLLGFGFDLAGAVSVIDPTPIKHTKNLLDLSDPKEMASLTSRSSLSGIQPKITLIYKNNRFFPTQDGELSTHIAKFPSLHHADLVSNEYLTTMAFKKLIDDDVVDMHLGKVEGFPDPVLIIKRFDRDHLGGRIHFEEFNQLLNFPSGAKYDGSYKMMSDFILTSSVTIPTESYRLYLRILAGLLLGNTDMHLKNFAMLHTPQGLRLSPTYDQVASALYQYKTIALFLANVPNLRLGNLKPDHLIRLGLEFNLPLSAIDMAFQTLQKNKAAALEAIFSASLGHSTLKNQIIQLLEKRWNGSFALIGKHLSKKL